MSLYLGTTPITPAVPDVANQSLSNLNSTGQNIANWSNNVTNCLVEIPQDINLELSGGTLTLKAGSKVYIPNGFEQDGTTPKFDEITVPSDVAFHTGTIGTSTSQLILCCNSSGGFGSKSNVNNVASGSTSPGSGYFIWYDTANNLMKISNSGDDNWVSGYSLPVGIYQRTNGEATAINNIFNGFGYIGSTVFALPNVKGLMPNGRLPDGTLNNTEFTLTTVLTATRTWNRQAGVDQLIAYMSGGIWYHNGYFTSETEPEVVAYTFWYNPKSNVLYYKGSAGGWTPVQGVAPILYCGGEGTTKINGISRIKDAFRAVDWSDRTTVSGWSMPSDKYVDLTLGSSGATYTAPANGWFVLSKAVNATQQYILFLNSTNGMRSDNYNNRNNNTIGAFLPCKKGDIVSCSYSAGGLTSYFRFVYAEGENV